MDKHTAGPWHIETGDAFPGQPVNIVNSGGWVIAPRLGRDNAARIVACVNYCEGIENKELAELTALDRQNQREAMDRQIARLSAQRDEARADHKDAERAFAEFRERIIEQRDELAAALRDEYDALRAQRDELAAALRGLSSGGSGRPSDLSLLCFDQCRQVGMNGHSPACEAARAALAKLDGGK